MRLVNVDELLRTMKVRDDDNGGDPLNAVDRGYHLAVTHLEKEIENLPPVNAIVIPNNATFGDVFESIVNVDEDCIDVYGKNGTMTFTFSQELWESPYKR